MPLRDNFDLVIEFFAVLMTFLAAPLSREKILRTFVEHRPSRSAKGADLRVIAEGPRSWPLSRSQKMIT